MTSDGDQRRYAIEARIAAIRARIDAACEKVGRDPAEVALVAVSKAQPAEALQAAYDAGQRLFGESYVQEWREKVAALPADILWHFIGRLQSNKARYLADGPVACVQSVDRLEVAQRLAARCGRSRTAPLPVMIEVDLSGEESKGGVAGKALGTLVAGIDALPELRLDGLMAIPAWDPDPEATRPAFARLARLRDEINAGRQSGRALRHLSMGMSHDFEVAIEEGATLVRVGTAIFGER